MTLLHRNEIYRDLGLKLRILFLENILNITERNIYAQYFKARQWCNKLIAERITKARVASIFKIFLLDVSL